MQEFSIDLASERIHNKRIREYFEEVKKSYYIGNYRSAIVILYTITITDLVYKLIELKDTYSDKRATDILQTIEQLQTNNPKSPDWESKLVEELFKRNMLDASEKNNIEALKNHRHLCAHPIITQNYELYNPTKENARSHIRNILEGILVKSPILWMKKIFDEFKNYISQHKDLSVPILKSEIKNKYFSKLNEKVISQIFKPLWKICFKVDDSKSNENRGINIQVLYIFLEEQPQLVDLIDSEKDYFSENTDKKYYHHLITLFNKYYKIYNNLNDAFKDRFNKIIEEDFELKAISMFLHKHSASLSKHIQEIINYDWGNHRVEEFISFRHKEEILVNVRNYLKDKGYDDLMKKFCIEIFGESYMYEVATHRFDELIEPLLNSLEQSDFELLLEKINNNDQIYGRGRKGFEYRMAEEDNKKIKDVIDEKNLDIDFTKYPNFRYE